MPTDLPPPRSSGPPPLRTASFDEAPLHSLAAGTRRWVRFAGIGRILLWLGIAVCAAIALDLTASLAPSLRAVAGIGILLGAVALAISHLWSRPNKVTAATATQQVEAAHPEIGQMLRTARDASLATPSVSPVLKSELYRRAAVQLAGLDLKNLLPLKPARKWLAAGGLALAGLCIFLTVDREAPTAFARLVAPFSGITYTKVRNVTPDPTFDRNRLPRVEAAVSGRLASNVTLHIGEQAFPMNPLGGARYEVTLPASEKSFDFRIEAGDSSPALGTMECVDPAEFVSSSAEVALPEYTGQAPTKQDTADIDAVEGTHATLHFKMSAPMANASLKLPSGSQAKLAVSGSDLSISLDVAIGDGSAELTGTDARGHAIEPTQFSYKGFPDKLPVVEWIEPTKDIEATAVAELPLRIRVRDDFGIASYGVVLQAQGESKEILTRSVEAKDLRDLSELTAAALETFPLTIRDNVRLYAWAKDFKPRGDTRAVSQLRGVDIKQFKTKSYMVTATEAEDAIPPADVLEVEKLIKVQREILSDAFPTTQGQQAPDETYTAFGERETKLKQDGIELHTRVENEGKWPRDDVSLLAAALTQMGESANAWAAIKPQPGFDRADAALSTMLELRKNLMILIMKSKCKCLEPKPEEIPNSIADLAKEAERLAKEERDVSQQLQSTPDTERLNAIRRQQDVANSDTGELHARLIDHPEATPLVLSHMADAEKLVREATRTTRTEDAIAAAPTQLTSAADALDDVAKHLRALDEANMDQTLAEMSEEAKKAADAAKPKDKADEKCDTPGEKPGEQPKELAGEKPGEKPADKPGAGEKPGEKPGEGEGKSEQAGKGNGQGKPGQPGQPGQPGLEGELAKNDPNAANMAGAGEKPGEKPGDGPAAKPSEPEDKDAAAERKEALEKAARQAATNDDILKFFAERDAKDGETSRFDALRKETGSSELEKKLNDTAEGKTDGKETAEDLKSLAAALDQERELRRQSRLEALAKSREQAAELKKQAEARRDAARKEAQELAKINNGGFSFDIPKKPQGKGGKGDQPGKGGQAGIGGGTGSPGSHGAQDLAKKIDGLKDSELSRIARELEKSAPDTTDVKPLADAERRLAEMIAEISGLARSNNNDSNVPPAYRRAVEDYYRALSDDFGDEAAAPH